MKKNIVIILVVFLLNTITREVLYAQISGNNAISVRYGGYGCYSISPLSVSAENGFSSAPPFTFADISSSMHTYPSTNSPYTSLYMWGNHLNFHTGGVTVTPISFRISLVEVDNANGAFVRFNSNIPTGTGATGAPTYDYINIRKIGNNSYYYQANQ